MLGLGLLFTSFASRLHQILISQVIILGFGVSVLQSSHNVMLGKMGTITINSECTEMCHMSHLFFQGSILRRIDSIWR